MRSAIRSLIVLMSLCSVSDLPLAAKDQDVAAPNGWCYAAKGAVEVRAKRSERRKVIVRLGRGALLPMFEVKQSGDATWIRVRAVDPATLAPQMGWVDARQAETLPLTQYATDADLLKLLGGAYLDDFTAAKTAVARFLLRQGERDPALVCLLGSPILPQVRLQVFLPTQGKAVPGPFLEFAFVDLQSAIKDVEVRDLFGDNTECLLTREVFSLGPENHGVNLVIRKIEAGTLKTLWTAPVDFRSLASFPPQLRILQPPEKNIGARGTVTAGTVEFRSRGRLSEPVWKGKVEFHAFGRETPVETIAIEKVCAWDGTRFAPLY